MKEIQKSMNELIKTLSSTQCQELAQQLSQRAKDLRQKQPTYELAFSAGIEDVGYDTVRWGWVASYRGRAEITLDDGSRWLAIGHGPKGNAEYIARDGFIEFRPIESGDE